MTTTERSVEETNCEKYEHIPEAYDIAFWHCKVCKKELVFITLPTLQAERQKREEVVELLKIANCPDSCCDNYGTCVDGFGEPYQCQWCYERSEALTHPNNPK